MQPGCHCEERARVSEVVENKGPKKDSLKLEAGRKGRRVQRIGQLPTRRQCVFRDGNRLPDRGITNGRRGLSVPL